MNLTLLLRRILVLDDFQHLSALAPYNAPIALGIRHDGGEDTCLCPRMDVLFVESCQELRCKERCIAAKHHDRSTFISKKLFRLQDGMSCPELLFLFYILHTVPDRLTHCLTAKARDNNIAACSRCIRRINDMLQHCLSGGRVQHLWQFGLHTCSFACCQYHRYKIQHNSPPVSPPSSTRALIIQLLPWGRLHWVSDSPALSLNC